MSILAFRQKIALWVDMYDLLWRVIIESYQVYENMQTVNQYILDEYIAQQSISVEFEQYLKSWPLTGHLKLTNMTTTKIHDLCLKINSHDIITRPTSLEVATGNLIAWKKGELKLFLWVLVYYCFHHDTHIISLVMCHLYRKIRIFSSLGPSSPANLSIESNSRHTLWPLPRCAPSCHGKTNKLPFSPKLFKTCLKITKDSNGRKLPSNCSL